MEQGQRRQIGNIPPGPWQQPQSSDPSSFQGNRRPITGSGDPVTRHTPAHSGYAHGPTFGGFPISGYGQGATNTPPGLHAMPSSGSVEQGDDNLSFFTKSQIHPGVIQPPKREADTTSIPREKPAKRLAQEQEVSRAQIPEQRLTSSER